MHLASSANRTFLCISTLLLLGSMFGALADVVDAADALAPLDLRNVKVGGEIGRRIDVTVRNNLLVLDAEKDFLAPFRARPPATAPTPVWAS